MHRNYGMEIVRVTEICAINASRYSGLGDSDKVISKAREAALATLDRLNVDAVIKNDRFLGDDDILQIPQKIGQGGRKVDIIMTAVEGHKICAEGGHNATSFMALASENGIRSIPNFYMYKIAVAEKAKGVIDINQSPTVNIKRVARALNKYIENITVCILHRERHRELIKEVRKCGARIKLISDGDISGSIAAAQEDTGIDIMMGYGRAAEGVMTAAAIKCIGGEFLGRIKYENDRDKEIAQSLGIDDFDKIYTVDDLITTNEISFAATGVTDGEFLDGVNFLSDGAKTDSFVTRGTSHTFRRIISRHHFDYKPVF